MNLLVNIDVDDLPRAAEFYVQALGLQIGRRFGNGAVELLGAGSPIYLLKERSGTPPFPGAATVRDFGRHWTPVHLDFVVDDLEPALKRAVDAGARLERAIVARPWGRMANLSDPWGHGLCLLQFTGRGYDELV